MNVYLSQSLATEKYYLIRIKEQNSLAVCVRLRWLAKSVGRIRLKILACEMNRYLKSAMGEI